MRTRIVFNKLISRTFDLVKVNQILSVPFLIFLLLVVMVMIPAGGASPFVLVALLALKAVFISGWLNMFHMCIENTYNENLSDEQKTLNSLNLYKEFFPGVGKYFQKIFWGIIIFVFVINFSEALIIHFLGNIKSLASYNFSENITTRADLITFWNKINPADKAKIYRLAIFDVAFILVVSYLTMFWTQFVVVEDKNPLKAFFGSMKAVLKDPVNTFLIFLFTLTGFVLVFVINVISGGNAIIQLIALMLFSYVMVYFTMMGFLYFERYR